mmetsp:Transcript_2985/g.8731  ORF Transcript_2985/g.8731 Transcript_2985/m.8731 type:complete len:164 (+) Transcript_2985:226-717(+)|eukprot:CAMPEP_0119260954 /NCGR_PEP_ID=MMETSP1329-20130426/1168_1 /TAXON_ID=114041 /ORGANISM="Genus nov. species nov., Strain RCC1024" /LENGTH=163 /DNA_ID=CAMNT_0007260433 /DNA_START=86 /DNA_END=577 /DNA_ORIENTATION=-
MLDADFLLASQFGAPVQRKVPPAPVPVVTPPSTGKRKTCDTELPYLDLGPAEPAAGKKRLPVGWFSGYTRRCGECGDDLEPRPGHRCLGKTGCDVLVCDACHAQSRRGQLRALAPRLRDATYAAAGAERFRGLLQDGWSHGRVCERCLSRLELRLEEERDAPL